MKRMMMGLLAAATLAAVGGTAYAGLQLSPTSLVINTTSKYAQGGIADTRNTANSTEYLACEWFSNTTSSSMECWGHDSGTTSFSCTSSNANLVAAAQALHDGSVITVYWDASGNCTYMNSTTGSFYGPKAH